MFSQQLVQRWFREMDTRGRAALDAGDYDLAVTVFAAAVKLDPTAAAGHVGHGVALLKLGRYRDAIGDFSRALRRDPEDGFAYYCRGLGYEGVGCIERAEADYARSAALAPMAADFRSLLTRRAPAGSPVRHNTATGGGTVCRLLQWCGVTAAAGTLCLGVVLACVVVVLPVPARPTATPQAGVGSYDGPTIAIPHERHPDLLLAHGLASNTR